MRTNMIFFCFVSLINICFVNCAFPQSAREFNTCFGKLCDTRSLILLEDSTLWFVEGSDKGMGINVHLYRGEKWKIKDDTVVLYLIDSAKQYVVKREWGTEILVNKNDIDSWSSTLNKLKELIKNNPDINEFEDELVRNRATVLYLPSFLGQVYNGLNKDIWIEVPVNSYSLKAINKKRSAKYKH